MIALKNNHSS